MSQGAWGGTRVRAGGRGREPDRRPPGGIQTSRGLALTLMPTPALDIEDPRGLVTWLRETGRLDQHEPVGVERLAGGVSNRVVRLTRSSSGEQWVLKQALAKLRVDVEWHCPVNRVHREALGMQWLAKLAPAGTIPRLLFDDTEHHVIAMDAVPSPHSNWREDLMRGAIDGTDFTRAGALIGSVHRRSAVHRAELEQTFADRTIFEVLRLEPFYEYTARAIPGMQGFLTRLIEETRSEAHALVHGDFSPKNLLRTPDKLILVDHEVIHWGDPMFDLGFFAAHVLCKMHAAESNRAELQSGLAAFRSSYLAASSNGEAVTLAPESEGRAARHALACFAARAVGRSPAPYLDKTQRQSQAAMALALAAEPIPNLEELTQRVDRGLRRGPTLSR